MKTKVYYADTDAGGVVYYANYLRWLEMARCDLLEEWGMSVGEFARQGVLMAVSRVEIDYRAPAVLSDEVEIVSRVVEVRRVRFTLEQRVIRCGDGVELAGALVTVATVSPEGKVLAVPDALAQALREHAGET